MPNRLLANHIHVLDFRFFSEECIAALIETNTSLLDLRVAHVEFPMAEELDSPDPDVRERFKKRFVKNRRTLLQGRTRNRVERALRENPTLRNLELNFDRDFEGVQTNDMVWIRMWRLHVSTDVCIRGRVVFRIRFCTRGMIFPLKCEARCSRFSTWTTSASPFWSRTCGRDSLSPMRALQCANSLRSSRSRFATMRGPLR